MIRYKIIYFLLIMPLFLNAAAVKRYVKPEGSGSKSGFSWVNASDNLQQTINASADGDTIWVAAGTYKGGFTLKQGVNVFGGFSGNETTLLARRLPGTGENLTILDGNNENRVLTQDTDFVSPTVIDGFVIQNGSALAGAGVYLRNNSILRRCIVRRNVAGEIRVGDYVPAQGGIIFRMDKQNGVGYIVAGENHGQNYQNGKGNVKVRTELDSALLDMNGPGNSKSITNSRAVKAVTEYRATAPGDGFSDWYIPSAGEWGLLVSGGPFMGGRSELCEFIEQRLLAHNMQTFGRQKYWSSTPASDGNYPEMWYADFGTMSINSISALQYLRVRPVRVFPLNTGAGHGGGIYASSGARIEGCLIYGNSAAEGSGIYTIGNVPVHYCTVAENTQSGIGYPNSQAVVTAPAVGPAELSSITNTIIWGNRDAENRPSNLLLSEYTRVLYTAWESETAVVGTGNIALPAENNVENGIGFKNPANNDYNLLYESACANTGDKRRIPAALTTDLNGQPRSNALARSMGAFESELLNSVENLLKENEIAVYPNPVQQGGQLTIRNQSLYAELQVSLVSVVGQTVYNGTLSNESMQIDMPYESGIYFVKISTPEGLMITKKITLR